MLSAWHSVQMSSLQRTWHSSEHKWMAAFPANTAHCGLKSFLKNLKRYQDLLKNEFWHFSHFRSKMWTNCHLSKLAICISQKAKAFGFKSWSKGHYKSDNLQYNILGWLSHRPSVWWSKYYFDRLKIKQWVASLDLGHSKLFIFVKL